MLLALIRVSGGKLPRPQKHFDIYAVMVVLYEGAYFVKRAGLQPAILLPDTSN